MAVQPKKDTSRLEDYLEAIYNLNKEKGFISTVDLSAKLGVKPPTVSSMVSKLASQGYLVHERYRGMKLTDQGTKMARSVIRRHETISEFLRLLGVDARTAYLDSEGIEHYLHPATIFRLERLIEFLKNNPQYLERIKKGIEEG